MKKHDNELHAMKVCAMALEKLTVDERRRALAWLQEAVLEYSEVLPLVSAEEAAK